MGNFEKSLEAGSLTRSTIRVRSSRHSSPRSAMVVWSLPPRLGEKIVITRHGKPAGVLVGFGSEEDLQQSARAGFAEHLTKPIDLNRLESAIRRVTSPLTTGPDPGDPASPARVPD